jgi:hypothetical protein
LGTREWIVCIVWVLTRVFDFMFIREILEFVVEDFEEIPCGSIAREWNWKRVLFVESLEG